MKGYYTRTFTGMTVVMVALVAAALLASSMASEARERCARLLAEDRAGVEKRMSEHHKAQQLQRAIEPVRQFSVGWNGVGAIQEKEAAERIRSEIESIAQRQLGLVTDNAITPQAERFTHQGLSIRVQRVTLRASSKDLSSLMTWLGKVEERFPAALLELCDFSSNVGGNTGLTIRLVQPIQESGVRRGSGIPTVQDPEELAEVIAAIRWSQYAPQRVKGAIAVGFHRNPLQPAILGDQRPMTVIRDDSDEITPRVEMALDGKVRSVIRGTASIVVIDGRVFRIGDELTIGAGHERLLPNAKTKLKEIGDDRLVLHVAGGSSDRPLQCDVTYMLPEFLKLR